MPKFKNISATVVYTVEYHVDLEGEYDCLDEAEAEIVRLADHYLHHAVAPDPTHMKWPATVWAYGASHALPLCRSTW